MLLPPVVPCLLTWGHLSRTMLSDDRKGELHSEKAVPPVGFIHETGACSPWVQGPRTGAQCKGSVSREEELVTPAESPGLRVTSNLSLPLWTCFLNCQLGTIIPYVAQCDVNKGQTRALGGNLSAHTAALRLEQAVWLKALTKERTCPGSTNSQEQIPALSWPSSSTQNLVESNKL